MIPGRESTLRAIYQVYSEFGIPLLLKSKSGVFSPAVYSDDFGLFLYAPSIAHFFAMDVVAAAHIFIKVLALLFWVGSTVPLLLMIPSWPSRFVIIFLSLLFFWKILSISE